MQYVNIKDLPQDQQDKTLEEVEKMLAQYKAEYKNILQKLEELMGNAHKELGSLWWQHPEYDEKYGSESKVYASKLNELAAKIKRIKPTIALKRIDKKFGGNFDILFINKECLQDKTSWGVSTKFLFSNEDFAPGDGATRKNDGRSFENPEYYKLGFKPTLRDRIGVLAVARQNEAPIDVMYVGAANLLQSFASDVDENGKANVKNVYMVDYNIVQLSLTHFYKEFFAGRYLTRNNFCQELRQYLTLITTLEDGAMCEQLITCLEKLETMDLDSKEARAIMVKMERHGYVDVTWAIKSQANFNRVCMAMSPESGININLFHCDFTSLKDVKTLLELCNNNPDKGDEIMIHTSNVLSYDDANKDPSQMPEEKVKEIYEIMRNETRDYGRTHIFQTAIDQVDGMERERQRFPGVHYVLYERGIEAEQPLIRKEFKWTETVARSGREETKTFQGHRHVISFDKLRRDRQKGDSNSVLTNSNNREKI